MPRLTRLGRGASNAERGRVGEGEGGGKERKRGEEGGGGKEKGRRGREREMGTARPPQILGAVYAPDCGFDDSKKLQLAKAAK